LVGYAFHLIPKTEGEIDEGLKNDIDEGLEYFIIVFQNFNNSIRRHVVRSVIYLLISIFFVSLILLFFTVGQILLPAKFNSIPPLAYLPAGLFIYFSIVSLVVADLYMIFNLGSLLWFSLQKVRASLIIKNTKRNNLYWCKIPKGPKRYSFNKVELFQNNLGGFYHIFVYTSIAIILILFGGYLSEIIDATRDLIEIYVISGELGIPYSGLLETFLNTIDYITPINIQALLSVKNMASMSYIVGILLVFSSFKYYKNIQHHATRSALDWSPLKKYSFAGEYDRAKKIVKVANYHYIKKDKQERLKTLFIEILIAIVFVLTALSGNSIYLLLILNQ